MSEVPRLVLASLDGAPVPTALVSAFTDAGFAATELPLDALRAEPGPSDALGLIWTGGDWDAGFAALDTLPAETMRRNTVLVGPDPPDGLGPRIRRAGGLTFLRDPVPEWLMPLLAETVSRARREHPLAILGALRSLSETPDDSPLAVLKAIADVGGRLLHADRALAALQQPEDKAFLVLFDGESGVVARAWEPGSEDLELPGGLSDMAVAQQEIIVVPDVKWSRIARTRSGQPTYQAGLAAPARARFDGLVEPDTPTAATLNFYWRRPFLPTAGEMRILDVLSAMAGATLLRLTERRRLSTSHVESTAALGALPRIHGGAGGLGPRGVSRSLDQELRDFTARTLMAHASCPQLVEIWVRATPSSRGVPVWYSVGAPPAQVAPPLPDEALSSVAEGEPVAVPGAGGRWALALPLRPAEARALRASTRPARLGDLVAIFRSKAGAAMARGDMRSLAADLELGVRMLRRAADSGGVLQLSRVLASSQAPTELLQDMVRLVRDRLSSDGCRVFVVRHTAEGPRVALLSNSAAPGPGQDLGPIRDGRGLLDWVLNHDDWLAVSAAAPAHRTGLDAEQALTGAHGEVAVVARARRAADAEATHGQGESARLLVPLHSLDRVAGVLEVWRASPHPYDLELDTASLLHFAPHVASACRRVLQMESVTAELSAISLLTRNLGEALLGRAGGAVGPLREAYEALVAEVGTLASATHAVLLHHDHTRPGYLAFGVAWAAESTWTPALMSALRGFHMDGWAEADEWARQIGDAFPRLLERAGLGAFRIRELLLLPRSGPGEWAQGAVVLLDRAADAQRYTPFAQDLSEHVARSFLNYAGALLVNHHKAYATRLVERLGGPGGSAVLSAAAVLEQAAALLMSAMEAEVAIIYLGEGPDAAIAGTLPERDDLEGIAVTPGSLTAWSLSEGRTARVLDVTDARDPMQRRMDKDVLERLRRAFGLRQLRSWLCVPVMQNRRCVGAIKLLSSDKGPFFLPHHEEIAAAVATRAAWEIKKATRGVMLEELNRKANQLAGLEGPILAVQLVAALERWTSRYLVPDCRVALMARGPRDRLLVAHGSDSLEPAVIAALGKLSEECAGAALSWRAGVPISVDQVMKADPLPLNGVGEPLTLPGETEFEGHIFLLHPDVLDADAASVAREAGREASLLLNGERLRQDWILRSGLFRHAFLGPAQGLTSAARMLGVLAERAGAAPERVKELRVRVEDEAENIRLWRENQRLYMGGTIEIRPRVQALRPVVERCIERYRALLEGRGVSLRLDWVERGSLVFPFDQDAVDLALSNLLDNARKYVFYNREVTVGVRTDARWVIVWVEDVGHPIPDRLREDIYRIGKRIDWKDPLRPIGGQGLGLPMARAVVEAHQGQIFHTCELEGAPGQDRSGIAPHRVRFIMKLPHHWRRRP